MSDKSNCIRVVICWAFSLLCRDFKSSLCSPDINQSMMSVENVPDDAESQCSVSAETESVSSIEQESTGLPEDCHEDTDSLCSQMILTKEKDLTDGTGQSISLLATLSLIWKSLK